MFTFVHQTTRNTVTITTSSTFYRHPHPRISSVVTVSQINSHAMVASSGSTDAVKRWCCNTERQTIARRQLIVGTDDCRYYSVLFASVLIRYYCRFTNDNFTNDDYRRRLTNTIENWSPAIPMVRCRHRTNERMKACDRGPYIGNPPGVSPGERVFLRGVSSVGDFRWVFRPISNAYISKTAGARAPKFLMSIVLYRYRNFIVVQFAPPCSTPLAKIGGQSFNFDR